MSSEDERTIRRYLLQDLTESERQIVEERMMTDSDFFEEVTFAEDELVAEYARKGLKGAERRKFEDSFLTTPRGRQDLDFNRAFNRYISKGPVAFADRDKSQPRSLASLIESFWHSQRVRAAFAMGVMMIIVAFSGSLLVTERRGRSEIERLRAQVQQLERELADENSQASQVQRDLKEAQERNAAQEAQLVELKNASPRVGPSHALASGLLSVILSPGLERGSAKTQLVIPPGKEEVELRLRLATSGHERYSADVTTIQGKSIRHRMLGTKRVGQEKQVILRVPVATLASGDYEVKLIGVTAQGRTESLDSYFFAVVKN
ncbi:MAG TPA: hypothetical protein VN937_21745 [Blastocatellia bacterium]|nr:hypothetical protein [Blastocatellia bacterium]